MKKLFVGLCASLLLSGCAQEANNSVVYIKESADYVTDLNDFKNDMPMLIQETVVDSSKIADVKGRITEMRTDIQEFNQLTPPESFDAAHQGIVEKNTVLDAKLAASQKVIQTGEQGISSLTTLLNDNVILDILNTLKTIR